MGTPDRRLDACAHIWSVGTERPQAQTHIILEARQRYLADQKSRYKYMVHRGKGKCIKSYRSGWLRAIYDAGFVKRVGTGNSYQIVPTKKICMYDLRHCVATHMLDSGIPLPVVSGRLGHADPSITAGVYSHALDSRAREVAESLPPLVENGTLQKTITHITRKRVKP